MLERGVESYFDVGTTSLHFTSLHFTSLHFTSLHFTSLHFTSLHFTHQCESFQTPFDRML